jgi:glycogen operon protein
MDVTGCRNTLNVEHPRVLGMIMDSLRYWASEMLVDGFRFDLATTLARQDHHFSANATFFGAIAREPLLAGKKLIAEPWDLGVDGYQLGSFPASWSEWNDRYRDTLRRYWRGHGGVLGDLATRLAGSSDVFEKSGRGPAASINFITAHDGFTLEDLVSYDVKHNQANEENNQDGAGENFSANYGVEGPTEDPAIVAVRDRQKRNLLAGLLLSQGTAMMLSGDEFGRTQHGNNNAYCQDNATSWIDWSLRETNRDFVEFVGGLLRLRSECPIFRRTEFFRGIDGHPGGRNDVTWLSPKGQEMTLEDWNAPDGNCLAVLYAGSEEDAKASRDSWLLLLNASIRDEIFVLPAAECWRCVIDTALEVPSAAPEIVTGPTRAVQSRSLVLFSNEKAQ